MTERQSLVTRWLRFVLERFSPLLYLPQVVVIVVAHRRLYTDASADLISLLAIAFGSTAFLLRMRILDEVKDVEDDRRFRPERPLPRGLITSSESRQMIGLLLLVETIAFALASLQSLPALFVAQAFTGLMAAEFFVGKHLRQSLLVYAMTHTPVGGLLSLVISAAILRVSVVDLPARAFLIAIALVFFFTLFEVSRKTWGNLEERTGQPSYSKDYGQSGAAMLNAFFALGGVLCITPLLEDSPLYLVAGALAAFAFLSTLYAVGGGAILARGLRVGGQSLVVLPMLLVGFTEQPDVGQFHNITQSNAHEQIGEAR